MKNLMNKKVLTVGIISLLALVLVSAALVDYLSDYVSAQATVDSPLELKIAPETGGSWDDSLNLDTVYGGDEVKFRIKEINRANVEITSDLVITVSESGVVNDCEELDIFFYGGAEEWIKLGCEEENNNLEFRYDNNIIPVGQDEIYEVKAVFAPNAKGNYEATVQHMMPE